MFSVSDPKAVCPEAVVAAKDSDAGEAVDVLIDDSQKLAKEPYLLPRSSLRKIDPRVYHGEVVENNRVL